MDGAVERERNGALIGILVFLCVAIVGLVIGIVVANVDSNGGGEPVVPDCKTKKTYYDIGTCIEEVYMINSDIREVVSLYQESIQLAKNDENYDLAADLIRQRTTFLNNKGYCEQALQLLDTENMNGYSISALNDVYIRAIGLSQQCGDEDAMNKWNNLLFEINKDKDPNETPAVQNN